MELDWELQDLEIEPLMLSLSEELWADKIQAAGSNEKDQYKESE